MAIMEISWPVGHLKILKLAQMEFNNPHASIMLDKQMNHLSLKSIKVRESKRTEIDSFKSLPNLCLELSYKDSFKTVLFH